MKFSIGKVILAGMCIAVCAKAAVSLPQSPEQEDLAAEIPMADLVQVAATSSQETSTDAAVAIDPIIPATLQQCETPEEVLLSFAEERSLIADQRMKQDIREAELALAREKLDIERAALVELKENIESLLAQVEASQTADLDKLISFYQNMKPTEAAQIMNDMDIEVTVLVLATMNPRTAAPILAKMTPIRARAVSKIILERSQLPGDQDLNGIRLN